MKSGNSLWFAVAWLCVPLGLHNTVETAGVTWFQMDSKSDSCNGCHNLGDVLPEGHSREGVETIESCANCHSGESGSVALGWMAHWKHYALHDFSGDCWSCHSMEEGLRFGLSGGIPGTEIEVSRDKVRQMSSYYKSWASSEFLDRRHGEQGTDCLDCHSSSFPDEPEQMSVCLECHGSYPDLAEVTKNSEPNPHASHLGEIDCGHCHKSHEASVLVCRQCHESFPIY